MCVSKKCPDYAPYAEPSGECTVFCNSGNFEVAESVTDAASQKLFCFAGSCQRYHLKADNQLKRCVDDCTAFQMVVSSDFSCQYKTCLGSYKYINKNGQCSENCGIYSFRRIQLDPETEVYICEMCSEDEFRNQVEQSMYQCVDSCPSAKSYI